MEGLIYSDSGNDAIATMLFGETEDDILRQAREAEGLGKMIDNVPQLY